MDQAVIGRRVLTRLLTCALVLALAGCDPSPASRALQERQFVPLTEAPPADELQAVEPAPANATADAEAPAPDAAPENPPAPPQVSDTATADTDSIAADEPEPGTITVLNREIPPGTSTRLTWSPSEVFEGISTTTPVLVVNGRQPGPTLCLTAAIHGDELNGIEMVRRVLHELSPEKLRGVVIGVPIVNLQGFRRGSRYLPDRRDLNRYFPGNPDGSSAARIAYSLFNEIIRQCDLLVDLHTGSFYRTNLPQLRADLRYRQVRELTQGFGGMVVLHSEGAPGTLRRAATDAGIPAVTLEAGEPLRLQSSKVSEGVDGIFSLLASTSMIRRVQLLGQPEPVFYESTWIRADHGGVLFGLVRLGQLVEPGDVLGTITDPITNEQNLLYATARGRVLGMAVNQVVMPGFAAFRIGIETDGPPTNSVLAVAEWGQTDINSNFAPPDDSGAGQESEESDGAAALDPEETS
ncbi:MAG: succinylglutamate desuccinylase/aspartoacylase family protein [Gammaproteobacteria bacterium]|nr:succinylglutamate desuccinylase/aspartoacylase family protein [Gammaproteobacteria bacterium]